MSVRIDEAVMAELLEMAQPLLQVAASRAEVMIDDDAGPEDVAAAETIMGFQMCVQALMRSAAFSELGLVASLATATGVILAHAQSDKVALWHAFQKQMSAVITEVTADLPVLGEPAGHA